MSILDSCSRDIIYCELALCLRTQEIAEIITTALERVHGKRPRIVRDNGSQFVVSEWWGDMRHYYRRNLGHYRPRERGK